MTECKRPWLSPINPWHRPRIENTAHLFLVMSLHRKHSILHCCVTSHRKHRFLHCGVLDHVYRAVAWQRVDQIHYNINETFINAWKVDPELGLIRESVRLRVAWHGNIIQWKPCILTSSSINRTYFTSAWNITSDFHSNSTLQPVWINWLTKQLLVWYIVTWRL
jgi:hypothetical protein